MRGLQSFTRRMVWLLLFGTMSAPSFTQQIPTKVVLDRRTFSATDYAVLQELADQVASIVDDLIPGRMSEFVRGDITCFQLTAAALVGKNTSLPPPITLSGNYKLDYEPPTTAPGRTRIALFEVEPRYAPSFRERFVYQLSHELAHVKMGVRIDNALVETLAVAVSYEVLVRLGMATYATMELSQQVSYLPDDVQRAYAASNMIALQRYWQGRILVESWKIDDRPLQTLGAVLIRRDLVPWAALLGIALATDCPLDNPPLNTKVCAPNLIKMLAIRPVLASLGYSPAVWQAAKETPPHPE